MTDWRSVFLGAGGTLATFALDHFNTIVGTLCGLLTLALLSRKTFWTILDDWRTFRAGRHPRTANDEQVAKRSADGPE